MRQLAQDVLKSSWETCRAFIIQALISLAVVQLLIAILRKSGFKTLLLKSSELVTKLQAHSGYNFRKRGSGDQDHSQRWL
jgi:hypothetical protein